MKFTPEIVAALQTLKDAAENDFERHRIAVLEKDLTAPPKVEVIDDTHQKFDGVVYHKTPSAEHYTVNATIHRAVWTYFNGEIPQGNYNIHHIDINPANNNISNLALLTCSEHRKLHNGTPLVERVCPSCKKIFSVKQTSKQKCCSIQCSNAIKPHKSISYVEKTCTVCEKKFTVPYELRNQKTCSKNCANIIRAKTHQKPPVEKICPYCEKKFILRQPSDKRTFCSISCAKKYQYTKKINHSI